MLFVVNIKILLGLFLLLICTLAESAQTVAADPLDAAKTAYENGEYEQTIAALDAFERSRGTSPRLESLRALSYNELGKTVEAYKALQVYFRLTAGRDLSANEAHQDLIKLRDELVQRIEKEFEEKRKKADKEREKEAERAVAQLQRTYQAPETRRSGSSVPPPTDRPAASAGVGSASGTAAAPISNLDQLAELEMWRKISQSTVAMDYFLFLETFPEGQFAGIARKKMHEIGDPVWNEVRKSHDPFKYREFIKNNSDSPFLEVAAARMNELATMTLEWEKVKDSGNEFAISGFEGRFPNHPFAAEVRKARSEIHWRNVENSSDFVRLSEFIRIYPESPHAATARAKLDALRAQKPATTTAPGPALSKGAASGSPLNASVAAAAKTATTAVPVEEASRSEVGLARFNGVFHQMRGDPDDERIWTVFEPTGPCRAKAILSNSIVTYPLKDEIELDLSEVAAVRVKDGLYKSWVVEVEHRNDKFSVQQTLYTRKPKWERVHYTQKLRQKRVGILAVSDQARARQLASELEALIAQCKQ